MISKSPDSETDGNYGNRSGYRVKQRSGDVVGNVFVEIEREKVQFNVRHDPIDHPQIRRLRLATDDSS